MIISYVWRHGTVTVCSGFVTHKRIGDFVERGGLFSVLSFYHLEQIQHVGDRLFNFENSPKHDKNLWICKLSYSLRACLQNAKRNQK